MTRRSRNRYAREGNTPSHWIGVTLIAFVFIVLSAFAALYFKAKSSAVVVNAEDMCPRAGPSSITALLIDATDRISAQQKMALSSEFDILVESIPLHGRLDVYLVKNTQDGIIEPIIKACNSGRGADIDPLTGNPKRTEMTWKTRFEEPVERALAEMLATEPQDTSPIIESIQSVVLKSFSGASDRKVPHKLIVVSDMMQNSKSFNMYGARTPNPDEFKSSRSYNELRVDMRGISTSLWMLDRDGPRTRSEIINFWRQTLPDLGADNLKLCVLVESRECQ